MTMKSSQEFVTVAMYRNMERAERIIRALYTARVSLGRLSLIGRTDPLQAKSTEPTLQFGAWGMLSSSVVMRVSGVGLCRTAGFAVSLLNEDRTQVAPGMSPIQTLLRRLGLTEEVARHLEAEISTGYWLVIVRGERTEAARVERYFSILQGGAIVVYHSGRASRLASDNVGPQARDTWPAMAIFSTVGSSPKACGNQSVQPA